jgi:hypothetical protein
MANLAIILVLCVCWFAVPELVNLLHGDEE